MNGINNNPYLSIGTGKAVSASRSVKTSDEIIPVSFQAKEDKFVSTPKTRSNIESAIALKLELAKVKKQQGFIGKMWDGFKNLTGIGSGSDKADKLISDYEQGIASEEDVKNAIEGYKEGQEICVDVAADLASGILSVGAFVLAVPTGGASLAAGLALATGVGAGVKVGIKTGDAFANGKEYNGKDLIYDVATGGINGLLAPVTNGVGNTVTKTVAQKLGLKALQGGAEQVAVQGAKQTAKNVILTQAVDVAGGTFAKRVAALGAGMALDGAVSGSAYNMVRASVEGENVLEAGVQGAIGGMIMAPVIGGGFRLAAKTGKTLAHNKSTSTVSPPPQKSTSSVITPKTKVDHASAVRAAQTVTDDPKIQAALVRMAENEGIVIRTKEDAMPILQKQFEGLKDRKNLYVLDINPQRNNGMPKSNNLISEWYVEANDIAPEHLITLSERELSRKPIHPDELCSEWLSKSPIYKDLRRAAQKIKDNPMTIQEAREVIEGCKGLDGTQILSKYGEEKLAQAMNKLNTLSLEPSKTGGYAKSLAEQIRKAANDVSGEPITLVIPDDCSLSGSSILCDTVKILNNLVKDGNVNNEINIVFSPMVLGKKAQSVIDDFINPEFVLNDGYFRKVSALDAKGAETFKRSREAFNRVKSAENIHIEVADNTIPAVHFTETETFRQIGQEDKALQQKLLYLMQGPIQGKYALFGGFGDCGVMVVTPTDAFTLGGQTYAGKIPTNSVGFMEVLGQESGVLNDAVVDKKGVFTKGTGKGYIRYCEWDGLYKPKQESERIPIEVVDGNILLRQTS
ncbi:MAG: hypothetical protein NC200_05735 [Candidatus Gastranaerophilales bacterium]|nr:hypothetical protein [Candidatus Gastranaerophilales bacterium]